MERPTAPVSCDNLIFLWSVSGNLKTSESLHEFSEYHLGLVLQGQYVFMEE